MVQKPVLQHSLPHPPWLDPAVWRLPGVQPLDRKDWLIRDEAFAAQMALRDRLIAEVTSEVYRIHPEARRAARACYDTILDTLCDDPAYQIKADTVIRPDNVEVPLNTDAPLLTLGRLIQADVCLMQPGPEGHRLTGAILCFPAHWTLAEKIGCGMPAIHGPVKDYDDLMEQRVQRLFDAMRPGQFLWRANAILYETPDLFTPKPEAAPDTSASLETARYVRSERQVLHKLRETDAIVFTIHTYTVPIDNLPEVARARLSELVR